CLDWSERRYHLAGALGAALTARLFELQWIERRRPNRSVTVTGRGREGLRDQFGARARRQHQLVRPVALTRRPQATGWPMPRRLPSLSRNQAPRSADPLLG